VASIRCEEIDLEDVLQSFPATKTSFPTWYLGLPLHPIRRVEFQNLEYKISGIFAEGNWKDVNISRRCALVRPVLASQAIYHIICLGLAKEFMKKIISISCTYLLVECDKVTCGKCKVN
jgi:hypothetical protein